MHRTLWLALFSSLFIAGCTSEDPPPLFVDLQYQVRCLDCMPISQDNRVHDLMLLDGEGGVDVLCRSRMMGGERVVSFELTDDNQEDTDLTYALKIEQARIGADDPGADCLVQVIEGANTYEGACTGDEPTEEAPCRIDLDVEGGMISGEIHCQRIPNRGEQTFTRHVVRPLTDEPAPIEIHGCQGL